MGCFRTAVLREEDAMPKVIRVDLPEGASDSTWGPKFYTMTPLDSESLFMVAWINCRRRHEVTRELRDQRVRFLVRMEGI